MAGTRVARQDARIEDVLLENLALCRLRVSKVHHLIQELVYDDKVVANALLLELLEVLDEHGDETMEEEDDFGGIAVSLAQCKHWPNVDVMKSRAMRR